MVEHIPTPPTLLAPRIDADVFLLTFSDDIGLNSAALSAASLNLLHALTM
jgi:hypothetical protein